MKRNSGFSLVELVVTIAILGIIAVFAVPQYMRYRYSAYNGSAESLSKNFQIVQGAYRAQHGAYATDMNQLVAINKNLLDTPGITFNWITADAENYVFNVRHARGNRWYTATP